MENNKDLLSRITIVPGLCGGKPTIRGMRITVTNVLELLAGGMTEGEIPAIIPYDWAAIELVACSVVGIVFGVYPAWKAANLDPIEALRYV